MRHFDFHAVEIFDADGSGHIMTACNHADCLPVGIRPVTYDCSNNFQTTYNPDDVLQTTDLDLMPIYAGEEMDYYPSCEVCGEEHTYVSLTEYGEIEEAERENERRELAKLEEFHKVQQQMF